MNIYVGNLSYDATEGQLQELFSPFGEVQNASIVIDRATGRSRGFGFVEMADDGAGQKAIDELDGKDFAGRPLKVNEARPKTDRPPRRGGSGGGSRFGGGGRR